MARKHETKRLKTDAATQEFRQFAWNLVGALSERKASKRTVKPKPVRRAASKKAASK